MSAVDDMTQAVAGALRSRLPGVNASRIAVLAQQAIASTDYATLIDFAAKAGNVSAIVKAGGTPSTGDLTAYTDARAAVADNTINDGAIP